MTQGHYHKREGHRVRKAYKSKGDDVTFSRFVKTKSKAERIDEQGQLFGMYRHVSPRLLSKPPMVEGRTFFNKRGVKKPSELKRLLVSGHNNVKIGRDVRKGKLFRGYWIYTLSLEERKTCPRSCHHWATCYGNNMPYAKRIDHTQADFLPKLAAEIEALCNPPSLKSNMGSKPMRKGVLIRLHALGDFYSSEYVEFWIEQLKKYDNLAIFGYTARADLSEIGKTIHRGKLRFGRRFAIRWSDGRRKRDCTASINTIGDCPANAIICPEQTGHSEACGKCGLCWNTQKNIAFLTH